MDAYSTEYGENYGGFERSFSYFHNILLTAITGCRNHLRNGIEGRLSKVALTPSFVTKCIDSDVVLRRVLRISQELSIGSLGSIVSFHRSPTCLYKTRISPNNLSLLFTLSTDACSINVSPEFIKLN